MMSNGLLDSSHRRPRRRASLIDELALPVTTLQRNSSSGSRPLSNYSRESSQSWEHSDTQLNNSSLPACLSDPSDHQHDTTNATDGIRVHRPNWVKSTAPNTTTNNHHIMEQAAMSNSARTRRPRPQLLKSASMRSSFTFGRRSTAPDDINALLDGKMFDRQRKSNGGGWNHRLSLGNGDRPDMKKVLEDNSESLVCLFALLCCYLNALLEWRVITGAINLLSVLYLNILSPPHLCFPIYNSTQSKYTQQPSYPTTKQYSNK